MEGGVCRMNSHPGHGKGGVAVSGSFCSCSCPAVALVAVSVCQSVQPMPGTLLVWFFFLFLFFCISSCKRDVRKSICSPKISSGADFLCFLCHTGCAWVGAVGCCPGLCSCLWFGALKSLQSPRSFLGLSLKSSPL